MRGTTANSPSIFKKVLPYGNCIFSGIKEIPHAQMFSFNCV
jgi:hypothetical protein